MTAARLDSDLQRPARRSGRVAPWILVVVIATGMGLLFLLPVVVMLLMPAGEEERTWGIAQATMEDGTILVVEGVTVGSSHSLDVAKAIRAPSWLPWQEPETHPFRMTTASDQVIVWFSRRDPETGRYLDFDWWLYSVADDGQGHTFEDTDAGLNYVHDSGSGSYGGPRPLLISATSTAAGLSSGIVVARSSLPQIRHDGDSFRLKVYDVNHKQVAELDVPHVTPPAPTWQPETLPITKQAGDLQVTVQNVTGRANQWTSNNRLIVQPVVEFDLDFEQNGQPASEWYAQNIELSDPLGNKAHAWDCRLSQGEPAWKVTMQLARRDDAQFSEQEIWPLPDLEIPDASTFATMALPEVIQGVPLVLEGIGGPGTTVVQGLDRSGSGGSYSGSVFGRPFSIETRGNHSHGGGVPPALSTTTVKCSVPFVVFSRTVHSGSHQVSLLAEDHQGRPIKTVGPKHVGSLEFWFLDLPEEAKTVHLKLIIQQLRSIEFFISPDHVALLEHLHPLSEHDLASRLAAVTSRPLLYGSNRIGNVEIFRLDPTGGLTNLTQSPALNSGCAWSPDGSRIAFVSDRPGNMELFVMSADGSGVTQLTDFPGDDRTPTWSPDGTQLCFTRTDEENNWELYRINADGSDLVNLTNHSAADADPAWSPDGSRIAFTSTRNGNTYWLYTMNADGSDVQLVSRRPSGNVYPAWSPDSRQIVFTGQVDGAQELFVCDANGENERQLTKLGGLNTLAAWSPDDDWIAFIHVGNPRRNSQGSIYVIRPDGSDLREIVPLEAFVGHGAGRPAWQPGP